MSLLPYGFRFRPGSQVKAKLINVVPQCGYADAGHSTAQTVPPIYRNWNELWSDWNWPGWIKPQIDNAFAYGANGVKIECSGMVGNLGTFPPLATLTTRIQQFCAYVAQKGGMVYFGCGGGPDTGWFNGGTTIDATNAAAGQAILRVLDAIPNICGIDLCNEIEFNGPSAWNGATNAAFSTSLAALMAAARPFAPSVPMTVSVQLTSRNDWTFTPLQLIAPHVDFLDVHPYYGIPGGTAPTTIQAAADVAPMLAAPWFQPQSGGPGHYMIGELGVHQAVPSATRSAVIAGVGTQCALPQCYGGNLFAGADFLWASGANNQYGVTDLNVQNPRTDILAPFQSGWPRLP